MKYNKILLLVLSVFALAIFAGCNKEEGGTTDKVAEELDIIFSGEASQRTMTYLQETPLQLPNGETVVNGELKPMWTVVQDKMGFNLNDKTDASKKTSDMWSIEATDGFKNADVYGGPNLGTKIMNAGANDKLFVNLTDHLDQMPDFKAYLEANPTVKTAITASDGNIYHVPYIAEIGNYARTFNGRYSWVEILLDGTKGGVAFPIEAADKTQTLDVNYEGYWGTKRNTKNVIALQNAAAVNGKLSQEKALEVLKKYIEDTYPDLDKLSDLYLGEKANYDIDELVALWRVVRLSPSTLTKEAYGSPKADAVIYPYFTRQNTYREDYLRLITYFGGTRVHGSDSYATRFYTDKDGNLKYSYYEDDFLQGVEYLKDIASEGLIDPQIYELDGKTKTNVRSIYYFADKRPTTKQYGFMTFDWISSTTALGSGDGEQDDVIAMLPPVTTTPVSNGKFIHFIENTRVVKPDGWGISSKASEERVNAACKLFNFFFTQEGNDLQVYGPDYLHTGNKYVRPDGKATDYIEFKPWVKENATKFKNGNISDFLRDYVGALMPIGYQKNIGFEMQAYSVNGWKSVDILENAKVLTLSYSAENPYYRLVATPPLNKAENAIVDGLSFTSSADAITQSIFDFIGGSKAEFDTIAKIKAYYEDNDVETYIATYKNAFKRISK